MLVWRERKARNSLDGWLTHSKTHRFAILSVPRLLVFLGAYHSDPHSPGSGNFGVRPQRGLPPTVGDVAPPGPGSWAWGVGRAAHASTGAVAVAAAGSPT